MASLWRREALTVSGKLLIVRLADCSDYHDVIAIDPNHEIYNGKDYIPTMYYELMHDKDAHPFVFELLGEIVRM